MKWWTSLVMLLWTLNASGQKMLNLVPNPSFEETFNLPIYPNPRNSFEYEPQSGYKPFQKNLKYWFAGSRTTPDLRIMTRENLQACNQVYRQYCDKAHTGTMAVGIITFLKNTETDTYREYIQVKLVRPLTPKVEAKIELWVVKERTAKLVSNNIGLHFSYKKVQEDTEENIDKVPQILFDSLINKDEQKWVKLEARFMPDKPYRYLLIGNFFRNEKTLTQPCKEYAGSPYTPPYASYLIDDIKVLQPLTEKEVATFDGKQIGQNELVRLKNIFFETDKSELKDSSMVELNKLFKLMQEKPDIKIAIHGHTDNVAPDAYNLRLSKARAQAVVDFLIDRGIAAERLRSQGFGEHQPLESNETKEGRAVNRRVEFKIL
ncbi:MAG: OmpA family protein [Bacteroidota bacterium]